MWLVEWASEAALFALLFLALIAWILLSVLFWSIKNGITPTPTSRKVAKCIVQHLPQVEGAIVDLGSGFGTMAFTLADHFPERRVSGFETSAFPYLVAILRQKLFPRHNLTFYRRDFFLQSLRHTRLVYCYLYPGVMQKLQGKLLSELPKDSIIISNTFAFPSWTPTSVLSVADLYHTKIYIYNTPHG